MTDLGKFKEVTVVYNFKPKFQKTVTAIILVKAVFGSPISVFIGYIDSLVRGFCLS